MKKTKELIPTENEECEALVQWLDLNHYMFSHIQNEQKSSNWGAIMRSKRLGVRKGVPDFLIIGKHCGKLIFLEMKRKKMSKLSVEQGDWIDAINNTGNIAEVCYGAEEAINYLKAIDIMGLRVIRKFFPPIKPINEPIA